MKNEMTVGITKLRMLGSRGTAGYVQLIWLGMMETNMMGRPGLIEGGPRPIAGNGTGFAEMVLFRRLRQMIPGSDLAGDLTTTENGRLVNGT
jgi:hypothetical protein